MTDHHVNLKAKTSVSSEISSVEEIIEEARAGRPVILIDDEGRENEGDLIIPAECVTPEVIAFMAKQGSGLICLAMEAQMIDRLELPLIGKRDNSVHKTAFAMPIEAKKGITTGISAADRTVTIKAAINPNTSADDIATPGHVFPLRAVDGGVLERDGHTEAAVDIAKLAGFSGAGVICEIMKEDGTMARFLDLCVFAKKHNLKLGTIADLIAYRKKGAI